MLLIEKIFNHLSAQGYANHLHQASRLVKAQAVLMVRLSDGFLLARVKDDNAKIFSIQANLKDWNRQNCRCDCHQAMPCVHLLAAMQSWLDKHHSKPAAPPMGLQQLTWTEAVKDEDGLKWDLDFSGDFEQGFTLGMLVEQADQTWNLTEILVFLLDHYNYADLMRKDEAGVLELVNAQGYRLRVAWSKIKWLLNWMVEARIGSKASKLELGVKWDAITRFADQQAEFGWQSNDAWRGMGWLLRSTKPKSIEIPGFNAQLRPYQQAGVEWLYRLHQAGFGGILADDMGLGKTVQVLAYLSYLRAENLLSQPALIVMPTSLLSNWLHEAEKYSPDLKVSVFHGARRSSDNWCTQDLILTSYGMLQRQLKLFQVQRFSHLILDEAQMIKNFRSQKTLALKTLNSPIKICLSGTPIENHYGELWSLVDFAVPGLLGTQTQFRKNFRYPLEKKQDVAVLQSLKQRLSPFVLRRSKQDVLAYLPPKNRIVQQIRLNDEQSMLYDTLRAMLAAKVQSALSEQGFNNARWLVLDALLKLRQICCDARLLPPQWRPKTPHPSAKLDHLIGMLVNILAENRFVLVFSQFTSMLNLIAAELEQKNLPYLMLTGKTQNRAEVIQRFQQGEAPIFLLSMKVGGLGLNLTRADTVIHYEPWWNPAVSAQATDRIHRMGQTQAVFEYYLIAEGTIEATMMSIQEQKQNLFEQTFGEVSLQQFEWTEETIMQFFAPISST